MTTAEIPISGPGISDYSNEMLSTEDAAALLAEDEQYARKARAAAEQQDALDTLAAFEAKAFNPAELRDLEGRWTRTGSHGDLLRRMVKNGGFTFDVHTGRHEASGFVVAVKGQGRIFKAGEFTKSALTDYLIEKMPVLLANPHLRLGGWYDRQHDEVVLDLTELHTDRDEAIRLGQERDEQAIFDLSTGTEIATHGTGGRKSHGQAAGRADPPAGELPGPAPGGAGGLGADLHRPGDGLKFDPAQFRDPLGRWARVDALWGKGDLDALFLDGALQTTAPFPSMGRRKDRRDYDSDLIRRAIADHHEVIDVDPRTLSASQPNITRAGVAHYLNAEAERTGQLFADHDSALNAIPTIYAREDGTNIIVSGHHRAAVALLRGERLRARVVRGPWPSR